MTEKKTPEIKAPAPAVVEKAQEKVAEGEALNQCEQQALADQDALDRQRGYKTVDWNGRTLWQSLRTGHTAESEYAIVQHHAELGTHGIVAPHNG